MGYAKHGTFLSCYWTFICVRIVLYSVRVSSMGALWKVGQNVSVMPGATVFLFLSLQPPVQQRRSFFSFQIRILPSANLLSNNPIWPAPSVKDRHGACRSNLHLPPRIAACDRGREAAIRLNHAVCGWEAGTR